MRLRILVLVAAASLLAACSSSSSGGSANPKTSASTSVSASAAQPADPAAAKAEITANWEKFFNYKTPRSEQLTLIQDASTLQPAIAAAAQQQAKLGLKQAAQVTGVTFTSATQATVTYKLLNGTAVLLPSGTGTAVLVNGKWVVSKTTFCTLVALGANGQSVPGCS